MSKNAVRRGFTLLELLTVMVVMAIMTTIGVMGYFATIKGSAARGTLEHLTQTLSLARQTAIMQGKRVFVVFGQNNTNGWYSVCKEDGMTTKCQGELIFDSYSDWSDFVGSTNVRIFNLSNPAAVLQGEVFKGEPAGSDVALHIRPSSTFSLPSGGEVYGWEVLPMRSLARGLRFISNIAPQPIIFCPDGSPDPTSNQNPIQVEDMLTGQVVVKVSVAGGSGFITATLEP